MPDHLSPIHHNPNLAPAALLERALSDIDACSVSIECANVRTVRRARIVDIRPDRLRVAVLCDRSDSAALTTAWCEKTSVVTVILRLSHDELVFFSSVLPGSPPAERLESTREIDLTLAMPTSVVSTKRRQAFRVAVAAEDGIGLRIWRIDNYAVLRDQPPPSRAFKCTLCDLSASGLQAILWARRVEALQLVADQRFRVELKSGDAEMVFEARLRHPRATARDDEFALCGFEFVHGSDNFESRRNRQKLDAILSQLQRRAAREQAA